MSKCLAYCSKIPKGEKERVYTKCRRTCFKDSQYCDKHDYISEFTEKEQRSIRRNKKTLKCCSRCNVYRVDYDRYDKPRCEKCTNTSAKEMKSRTKKNNQGREKCGWPTRKGTPCGFFSTAEENNDGNIIMTPYCDKHKYANGYSKEEKKEAKLCKGCKMYKYWQDMDIYVSCPHCRGIGAKNRIKDKETSIIKCPVCGKKARENGYCGKHLKDFTKSQLEAEGHVICSNFDSRHCVNIIDDPTKYKRCGKCRTIGNVRDKTVRDTRKAEHKRLYEAGDEDSLLPCRSCSYNGKLEDFTNSDGEHVFSCTKCRFRQALVDARRSGRDRSHEYKTPEYKARKKEWERKNPEKRLGYWRNYRLRKMNADLDAYLADRAQQSKRHRMKDPERHKEYMALMQNKVSSIIGYYKRSARDKGKEWKLTNEEATNLILGCCLYCGEMADDTPLGIRNGIDCVDSDQDYHYDNCDSCCKTCNYMKCRLPVLVFIKRCEHILTYHGKIDGNMDYNLFHNSPNKKYYNTYKKRAEKEGINFELSKSRFEKIIAKPCYICGKENSKTHQNGVDRVNNNYSIGYKRDNCKSCCAECNFMKKDLELDEFMDQILKIHKHYTKEDKLNIKSMSLYDEDGNVAMNTKSILPSNRKKLTKEDKLEIKDEKRKIMLQRKNDSEIEEEARKNILEKRLAKQQKS